MRSVFAGVVGLFGLLVSVTAALGQPRTPREALEENHPGVKFYEVGGRTRAVYGEPMTAGETPEAAAEAWLALYGEIFVDGREAGGPDLRQVSLVRTYTGKAIFAYAQFVDGVPVESSSARVLVVPYAQTWRVAFASSQVALRPPGGCPPPRVLSPEALRAAQEHPAGRSLTVWRVPTRVAIYDDVPAGTGEARTVWKCIGLGLSDSRTFYVDALTGDVVRHFSNVMSAHECDVSGTITGKASPGTQPDRTSGACANPAAARDLPLITVTARDGTQTLIDSTFTDDNGDYVLAVPNNTQVTIEATLEGAAWKIINLNGNPPSLHPNCPATGSPVTGSTQVTAPATGVDIELNSSPSQYTTAQVNVATHLGITRTYIKDRASPPGPGIDDVITCWVNAHGGSSCNAKYQRDGYGCVPEDPPGLLVFTITNGSFPCINSGYSTWISHEYGHFLLEEMLGIVNETAKEPFHEGFADALAFLAQDTEIFGEYWTGCSDTDDYVRRPLLTDPSYPVCNSDKYQRAMLLGAIWIDLKNAFENLETVRQLHVDWMFLCSWPNNVNCGHQQAAAEITLIEVLTADDDDASLDTGTPNDDVICGVFAARGITTNSCPESTGRRCAADCDGSTGIGVLDVFDFLCFENDFTAGGSFACNCDTSTGAGGCDVFDFICFQRAFARGCP